VRTVDRCQGSEWNIVIFTTVRAGEDALGHTRDRRRVNVGMTRARRGFILVCDVDRFKLDQHIWSAYLVANESCVVDVASLQAYFEEEGVPTVRQRKQEDWMRENGDHGAPTSATDRDNTERLREIAERDGTQPMCLVCNRYFDGRQRLVTFSCTHKVHHECTRGHGNRCPIGCPP
jgi:hypothetical protein